MMTPAEQQEFAALEARVIDSEERVAYLHREFDKTLAALALAAEHAGLPAPEPEPAGQLVAFPAGRKAGSRKRAAGSAVPLTASRRVSTPGRAS